MSVYDEGELLRYEQQHMCDPVRAVRYNGTKPPSSEALEDSNHQILASGDFE